MNRFLAMLPLLFLIGCAVTHQVVKSKNGVYRFYSTTGPYLLREGRVEYCRLDEKDRPIQCKPIEIDYGY